MSECLSYLLPSSLFLSFLTLFLSFLPPFLSALRARSNSDVSGKRNRTSSDVSAFAMDLQEMTASDKRQYGQPAEIIGEDDNAMDIRNHIIIIGCLKHILIFIAEMRRPLIVGEAYHPILIVDEGDPPACWEELEEIFDDVYFMKGKITSGVDFNRTNLRDAHALVLLANRDSVTEVEGENLDADTLFAYLKLEKHLPRHLFFTVELTCESNMSVINSTLARRDPHDDGTLTSSAGDIGAASPAPGTSTSASQLKGTFAYQKRTGGNIDKVDKADKDKKRGSTKDKVKKRSTRDIENSRVVANFTAGRRETSLQVKDALKAEGKEVSLSHFTSYPSQPYYSTAHFCQSHFNNILREFILF